jgi:thiamine pyrophosphokinase
MLAEGAMVITDVATALVFCGGGRIELELPAADLVVAADTGLAEARRLGKRVDVLVGDLDSVSDEDADRVAREGGRIDRHPVDKDATDLELALEAALRTGAKRVVVAGGAGGRLDHLLGNALVLASPKFATMDVDAVFGRARLHVVRGALDLDGAPGELVSLFAVGGPACGVRTTGLRWGLHGEDLLPGSSRGTSNEFVEPLATVSVEAGVLVAVRPGVE